MDLIYNVNKDNKYKTIDEVLTNEFEISNRLRLKLIKEKKIYLNHQTCDTRNSISNNDVISIDLNYNENNSNIIPTKMDLNIIYEDEWLLAVDKPSNIPIHPSRAHFKDSLSNGIKYYFDSINLKKKIRPVNRLDIGTSGIVIFSKCEYIQECFIKQMLNKIFEKEYICLVEGLFKEKKGTINLPISRKPGSIIEREINNKNGKTSITHYEVIKEINNTSLVRCKLETGRTHQIRVHMKSINHPIIGDSLYNHSSTLINRQALHCYKLKFIHPISKKEITLISDIPDSIKKLTL